MVRKNLINLAYKYNVRAVQNCKNMIEYTGNIIKEEEKLCQDIQNGQI